MKWIELYDFEVRLGAFHLKVPSLALGPGNLVAVLGPNGSGKSTFLSALAGLRPYTGQYSLLGRDFKAFSEAERYRALTYLPQAGRLGLPFEVFYVVLTGRYPLIRGNGYSERDYLETEKMLRLMDLWDLRFRTFNELSGGERQRVFLARALNRKAKIVLLDEPFNGVDLRHQHAVLRFLKDYAQGEALVLVVLHDLSLAVKYFDYFLLFKDGLLWSQATRDRLAPDILAEVLEVKIEFLRKGEEILVATGGAN